MKHNAKAKQRRGSVLLLSLFVTGMIAVLALNFMSTMDNQINIARDQAASLHADLAAQAGLEYAQRQLLLNNRWEGTNNKQIPFADGPAFNINRLTDLEDELFESDVTLSVIGLQSAAIAQFEAILRVKPGDPLLDKAFSVLGDSQAENLQINGDYLLVDESGHLWQRDSDFDSYVRIDDNGNSFLAANGANEFEMRASKRQTNNTGNKSNAKTNKREIHVLYDESQVKGIWAIKPDVTPQIDYRRIESSGSLYNYIKAKQRFAKNQNQLEEDVHAPGWNLDVYLEDNDEYLLVENTLQLTDFASDKVVVVMLNPGDSFIINNCTLSKGLVVWAEDDFDFHQLARNTIKLAGNNSIGSIGNSVGILAPACEITTSGGLLQKAAGLSIVHSLNQVSRLIHTGVFIVLNSTQHLYDSDFTYGSQVAVSPPPGTIFFSGLPTVGIKKLYETGNFALSR